MPRVGVLSLQGDFACHRAALEALGAEAVRVTLPQDLARLDALILPGGESTTMLRLLESTGLRGPVEEFVAGRPVMGTCAGVILLGHTARNLPGPVSPDPASPGAPPRPFGVLDVEVERNAYGRQIDSFSAELETTILEGTLQGVFIRAPRIRTAGAGVEVVVRRRPGSPAGTEARRAGGGTPDPAGEPVGVRAGRIVGLCFHPELTNDLRVHHWFLTEVAGIELPGIPVPAATQAAHGRPA